MANYNEARIKLTNIQLTNENPRQENKTGITLTITKKNFQDEELLRELFLTRRQKTKMWNAFANNMLTDIKLSKAQISKITQ